MDLKLISTSVAVLFLACVGVTSSFYLSSIYRDKRCSTNLVTIDTDRCTKSSGRRQCPLNWGGRTGPSTNFAIVKVREEQKCIQFNNNGVHYALKVDNQVGSNLTLVFEEHQCSSTTGEPFIFIQTRFRNGRYTYQYNDVNTTMCIGATDNCSESLALVIPPDVEYDVKCRFRRGTNT